MKRTGPHRHADPSAHHHHDLYHHHHHHHRIPDVTVFTVKPNAEEKLCHASSLIERVTASQSGYLLQSEGVTASRRSSGRRVLLPSNHRSSPRVAGFECCSLPLRHVVFTRSAKVLQCARGTRRKTAPRLSQTERGRKTTESAGPGSREYDMVVSLMLLGRKPTCQT
jgi:hypothetical protein